MKQQFIYNLKKVGIILGVILAFALTGMFGLFLPNILGLDILYIVTIPVAIAIIITLIQRIEWDELFDFYDYECNNDNNNYHDNGF